MNTPDEYAQNGLTPNIYGPVVKERPILFSGPMVRALLEGRKTQTRRVVRKQFASDAMVAEVAATTPEGWQVSGHSGLWWDDAGACLADAVSCPHGKPGDRLWVRETFFAFGRWETRFNAKKGRDEWHFIDMTEECDRLYQYAADDPDLPVQKVRGGVTPGWWKRTSIHMPRKACRILLEVVSVRVERLNDISHDDACSEGIDSTKGGASACIARYRDLWESINGKDSWNENPWVWVVEFRRLVRHGFTYHRATQRSGHAWRRIASRVQTPGHRDSHSLSR